VTSDDLTREQVGFNNHLTGFSNCDCNYDGVINFDDCMIIDLASTTNELRKAPQGRHRSNCTMTRPSTNPKRPTPAKAGVSFA